EDPAQAVLRGTGGLGADILVETASSPKVWDFMMEMMAANGRMSVFGLYPESKFQPLALIRKGVTLYGDVAFLTRHFIRAIGWLESGKVSAQALVTRRFSLEQAGEAFAAFNNKETVKCLFEL
ncbi:MAG: zinc-binding dehydrogenase, partial [Spirochaetales bacterium]|nr:zinc-binding dehydrogenase [Spirochaetales bacterium]